MSSCAASSCICFPKASFAFATLVSLPTGGAPPSCRFAFNYSEQHSHRRPNQKPLLPKNRAHFGSVPNAAAPWWSSRDLPLPSSNSVLHPFPPEPLHESTITISFTRCPSPPATVVRSSGPKPADRFQPHLELSPQPHANDNPTNPACALANSTTYFPSPSPNSNPI